MSLSPTLSYANALLRTLSAQDVEAAGRLSPLLQRLVEAVDAGHTCLPCARPELPVDWLGQGEEYRPLVHDGARLFFTRHWQEEQQVARRLRALAGQAQPLPKGAERVLNALFPEGESGQKQAARQALQGNLTLIAGGPGTGKTTTVLRILAALLATSPRPLTLRLAAPTGKAAQRMSESLRSNKAQLEDLLIRSAIPETAQTLHRLLGYNPDSGQVRHDAAHPLALDWLVVDEASMIDLALMDKLLAALPPGAGLILLGDPDQLTSVEAGSVFADLCAQQDGVVAARVARLRVSHRFAGEGGIGALAQAVNAGAAETTLACLEAGGAEVLWQASWQADALPQALRAGYARYQEAVRRQAPPAEAFAAFNAFRVLCARREGAGSVAELNAQIRQVLFGRGGEWYAGRPVMVVRNDYDLGLFNGDIGLALEGAGGLQVWFESEQGWRCLPPSRLPAHETAFALTVHKSQGSEFERVLLLLPEQGPGLTRNLLYTALTRARRQVAIWGSAAAVCAAVSLPGGRDSGLADKLQAG